MATNNFKPFATAANANVTAQADWEALPALLSGFMAGKASSAQVNKAIRQASFIAAALAQYTANKSGLDVLDDGDLNGFISKMGTAFGKDFQALDATLTALAGLATGANKLPYFTGTDTAAQTNLTSVGRDIIGKNTIADILTYLGLRTAAKADVVGTVSQSGGVPTGAIIERGSNSNGEYTKFADGTLICWFTRSVESITSNPSGGTTNLYFSTESVFTFPATFVGTKPAVAPSAPLSSGGTSSWPSVRGSSLTGTSLALISNVQNAAAYLGYTAVGRWF
ncbi:phage tail protein [Citrobacter freundii]|uniref:phage tail protein n=1 Tax=Citrobacter freundii TaxID=546 RepID=UPI001EF14A68|nr:phage tail protein [Citrobacter freundii]